jgi:pterin-4a-carbinolamine dehydratase
MLEQISPLSRRLCHSPFSPQRLLWRILLVQRFSKSSSTTTTTPKDASPRRPRPDPLAQRPTHKCDPYGQGGKPLSYDEAQSLLDDTLEKGWTLVDIASTTTVTTSSTTTTDNSAQQVLSPTTNSTPKSADALWALQRSWRHPTFTAGSQWLHQVAAVADVQAHYPISLHLQRLRVPKSAHKQQQGGDGSWNIVSTVQCHTQVLRGLSTHDFYLAMVRTYIHACTVVTCHSTSFMLCSLISTHSLDCSLAMLYCTVLYCIPTTDDGCGSKSTPPSKALDTRQAKQ